MVPVVLVVCLSFVKIIISIWSAVFIICVIVGRVIVAVISSFVLKFLFKIIILIGIFVHTVSWTILVRIRWIIWIIEWLTLIWTISWFQNRWWSEIIIIRNLTFFVWSITINNRTRAISGRIRCMISWCCENRILCWCFTIDYFF